MINRKILFTALSFLWIVLFCFSANSQTKPYFQQYVDYKIQARLNDTVHSLSCFEVIQYTNNSPDTLNFLYFHLWPNAYRDRTSALSKQNVYLGRDDLYYAGEDARGYIDSLAFNGNNKPVSWEILQSNPDIARLLLNEPLLPGTTIEISTPFYVKIPSSFSRLGHYGQSYQISQWYPKPAVYDKNGWHAMPYLDMGEFYSEYGRFDVSISLPENYVVGATGCLQNPEELAFLDNIADKTAKIKDYDPDDLGFPKSSTKYKTIRFVQDSVHDFAWFADKRFHVLKGKVNLPNSGREVTTWVMFTNYEGNLWKDAVQYVSNAVFYYSTWLGDYPYNNCTAVESALGAGGGMEYPMITNIGEAGNALSLEQVIVHEVGHNWLYGILGSNERDCPWMDEGINSFYEMCYMKEIHPDATLGAMFGGLGNIGFLNLPQSDSYRYTYLYSARNNTDQALTTRSEDFYFMNYATIAYFKGAVAFDYLMQSLGKEEFDRAMQHYFEEWKFKHPDKISLYNCFNDVASHDVSWFFDSYLTEKVKVDFKAKRLFHKGDSLFVKVKNASCRPYPFSVTLKGNADTTFWVYQPGKKVIIALPDREFTSLELNEHNLADIYPVNNYLRSSGYLKIIQKPSLRFYGMVDYLNRPQINLAPLVGWNRQDGLMPGALIYSALVPESKFEYRILTMCGSNSGNLTGSAYIAANIHPDKGIIRKLSPFVSYRTYTFDKQANNTWERGETGVQIYFNKHNPASRNENTVKFSGVAVSDLFNLSRNTDLPYNLFIISEYNHSHRIEFWKLNAKVNTEIGDGYLKTMAECTAFKPYPNQKKGVWFRLYGGKFLWNKGYFPLNNFRLSGKIGVNDYLFTETFPDRIAGVNDKRVFADHFYRSDAYFSIYTPIQSNDWMASFNSRIDMPIPFPVSLYGNVATYAKAGKISENFKWIPYEVGIEFSIIPDIFAIYFPVITSSDVKTVNELYTDTYIEKVRFVFAINEMNVFRMVDKISEWF